MLEGLKNVQWSKLSHAYGEASDVPELLLSLASGNKETRKRAIGAFFANIYHQGTVYQASAYAAPFLIELLTCETVQDKNNILYLLAHLASGDGYNHQHLQLFSESGMYWPGFEEQMEEQLFWVRKTHDAVSEGLKVYISLLEHQDIAIKMTAAYLLAHLLEHSSQIVPLLYRLFANETDERLKANLVLGLGALDIQYERGFQFAKQLVADRDSELLSYVAALAIMKSRRDDIPHAAIDLLIQFAMEQKNLELEPMGIPWLEWSVSAEANHALCHLTSQPATYAIYQLAAALQVCIDLFAEETGHDIQHYSSRKDLLMNNGLASFLKSDSNLQNLFDQLDLNILRYSRSMIFIVEETFNTLVYLAFGYKKLREGTRFRDLSSEQRFVLTTLLDCNLAWRASGGWKDQTTGEWKAFIQSVAELYHIGLPDTRDELQAFVQRD